MAHYLIHEGRESSVVSVALVHEIENIGTRNEAKADSVQRRSPLDSAHYHQ